MTPILLSGSNPVFSIWRVFPDEASPATQPRGICGRPPDRVHQAAAQTGGRQHSTRNLHSHRKPFGYIRKEMRSKGNCRKEVGFFFSGFKWDFLRNMHFNPIKDPLQSLAFSWAMLSKQTHNFSWSDAKKRSFKWNAQKIRLIRVDTNQLWQFCSVDVTENCEITDKVFQWQYLIKINKFLFSQ